jgi:hypothetical protein
MNHLLYNVMLLQYNSLWEQLLRSGAHTQCTYILELATPLFLYAGQGRPGSRKQHTGRYYWYTHTTQIMYCM